MRTLRQELFSVSKSRTGCLSSPENEEGWTPKTKAETLAEATKTSTVQEISALNVRQNVETATLTDVKTSERPHNRQAAPTATEMLRETGTMPAESPAVQT